MTKSWTYSIPNQSRFHRILIGVLSGASVLGSRIVSDLLAASGELFEIGSAVFLIYQTFFGDKVLGFQLTWVLLGYLVYAYTPKFLSDYFGDVIKDRGVRILITGISIYYGVLCSQLIGITPDTGAFGIVPEGAKSLIWAVTVGIPAGLLVFNVYFRVKSNKRFNDVNGEFIELFNEFTVESYESPEQFNEISSLNRVLFFVSRPLLLVIPGMLIGLAMAGINAFSPVPELIALAGVVISFVLTGIWSEGIQLEKSETDLEFGIVEDITGAFQNSKGVVLGIYCVLALGICGMVFLAGLRQLVITVSILRSFGPLNYFTTGMAFPEVIAVFAHLWFVFGLFVAPLAYGAYGMIYWRKQLNRLPLYVEFWEQYWGGGSETALPPVSRPLGLFLPADALILLTGGLFWMTPGDNLALAPVVVYDLAWPSLVIFLVWSVYAVSEGEVQSLYGEGRDVIVAFLLQYVSLYIVFLLVGSASKTGGLTVGVLSSLLLGGLVYFPETVLYSNRQTGLAAYIDVIYVGAVVIGLLSIVKIILTDTIALFVLFGGLFALYAVAKYVDETVTYHRD